jgi:hypothetical protein
MADKETEKKQTSGKKGTIIIAISMLLIIVLLGVIAFLLLREEKTEEPKRNVVVNQSNAEEIAGEMISQEYVAPGYYSASMTTTWHFETGDAASYDAYVANVAENTNDVYFDIFLAEQEDEPIYQSPVIPRGSELDEIILDKSLDAGTHDCILIYHLVDGEQKTVSTLRVALTIIVEN